MLNQSEPKSKSQPQNILIVEDDPSIIRLLEIILKNNNYRVYSSSTAGTLPDLVSELRPDLFILDIGLPDGNGIDMIHVIRNRTMAPIMMLSGQNTDIEKVTSLQLGADDYVVKPFSAAELLARIQALLRRYRQSAPPIHSGDAARHGSDSDTDVLDIDIEQHRVYISSEEIALTNKEFRLLHLLHSKKGKVLTRELILENVWEIGYCNIETRAVDACASRLRKKIRAKLGKDIIEAVPGSGYRLVLDKAP